MEALAKGLKVHVFFSDGTNSRNCTVEEQHSDILKLKTENDRLLIINMSSNNFDFLIAAGEAPPDYDFEPDDLETLIDNDRY